MSARLIDISPVLSARVAVWPGDTPFRRTVNAAIADGANIDLSEVTTTVHVGAHTDAPNHYAADGQAIHERPLDLYYGPCLVLDVRVGPGERIAVAHLPGLDALRQRLNSRRIPVTDHPHSITEDPVLYGFNIPGIVRGIVFELLPEPLPESPAGTFERGDFFAPPVPVYPES